MWLTKILKLSRKEETFAVKAFICWRYSSTHSDYEPKVEATEIKGMKEKKYEWRTQSENSWNKIKKNARKKIKGRNRNHVHLSFFVLMHMNRAQSNRNRVINLWGREETKRRNDCKEERERDGEKKPTK